MASRSGVDLAALDRTANPCDDFYQFACGGWMKKHPAPARSAALRPIRGAAEPQQRDPARTSSRTPPSLAAPRRPSCRRSATTTRAAWRKRTIETKGDRAARARPRAASTRSRPRPTSRRVVGYMHTVGMTGFFGFGSAPDFKDATQYMLIFGQGGLGLPDRDYYFKDRRELGEAARSTTSSTSSKMLQLGGATAAGRGGRREGGDDRSRRRWRRTRSIASRSATRRTSTTRCRATR